jgi:transcriptional repressor NrdR
MRCPYCAHNDSKVLNSRSSDEGGAIRRRRECPNCGRRFTTYERAQLEPMTVVKRGGRLEAFSPEKLLRGLVLACEKRPVTIDSLKAFAYGLEDDLGVSSISSEEVGRRAMLFLRPRDHVAYIRFASVYQEFDNVQRFIEEIQQLEEEG